MQLSTQICIICFLLPEQMYTAPAHPHAAKSFAFIADSFFHWKVGKRGVQMVGVLVSLK